MNKYFDKLLLLTSILLATAGTGYYFWLIEDAKTLGTSSRQGNRTPQAFKPYIPVDLPDVAMASLPMQWQASPPPKNEDNENWVYDLFTPVEVKWEQRNYVPKGEIREPEPPFGLILTAFSHPIYPLQLRSVINSKEGIPQAMIFDEDLLDAEKIVDAENAAKIRGGLSPQALENPALRGRMLLVRKGETFSEAYARHLVLKKIIVPDASRRQTAIRAFEIALSKPAFARNDFVAQPDADLLQRLAFQKKITAPTLQAYAEAAVRERHIRVNLPNVKVLDIKVEKRKNDKMGSRESIGSVLLFDNRLKREINLTSRPFEFTDKVKLTFARADAPKDAWTLQAVGQKIEIDDIGIFTLQKIDLASKTVIVEKAYKKKRKDREPKIETIVETLRVEAPVQNTTTPTPKPGITNTPSPLPTNSKP
ncbi:MAG: hypothetical protein LBD01_05580 [Puniceicoccales bacterium]|jgi:hypothetical protein|nr:hypothetical protein [Puniceicoccales bacterium]